MYCLKSMSVIAVVKKPNCEYNKEYTDRKQRIIYDSKEYVENKMKHNTMKKRKIP